MGYQINFFASKRIVRFDAKVFSTVPENKEILENLYGIPLNRMLYSPIGTDISMFRFDQDSRIRLREEEKLEEDACVLL